jgi:DNA mismatch repair protein MutS2
MISITEKYMRLQFPTVSKPYQPSVNTDTGKVLEMNSFKKKKIKNLMRYLLRKHQNILSSQNTMPASNHGFDAITHEIKFSSH